MRGTVGLVGRPPRNLFTGAPAGRSCPVAMCQAMDRHVVERHLWRPLGAGRRPADLDQPRRHRAGSVPTCLPSECHPSGQGEDIVESARACR